MTCADVRTLAAAEGDDLSGMRPRMADQPVPVRAVERDDRRSARLQPFENLAFCVGNGLLRRKEFAVSGSNPCDDRHMGTHKAGESGRSEEHTSELQSLMRISYDVFCLKKKKRRRKRQTI